MAREIEVRGASQNNLKNVNVTIPRGKVTVITGVSGSGKSSLAFDTILAESQRRFFYTLSNYTRQFLDLGVRPNVKSVTGLSPTISIAQNETEPSPQASIATFTELGELLGILLMRFGEKLCPIHRLPTAEQTLDSIVGRLAAERVGSLVTIAIPVATAKKGTFQTRISQLTRKGFVRGMVDGKWTNLQSPLNLLKDEKHDISIAVDQVKIEQGKEKRLSRSLQLALDEGDGVAEIWQTLPDGTPIGKPVAVSLRAGCPECGFSWPAVDARYFSANSLGRCPECVGRGLSNVEDDQDDELDSRLRHYIQPPCTSCRGTGVKKDMEAIQIDQLSILDLQTMPITKLSSFISQVLSRNSGNQVLERVAQEVLAILARMENLELSHLQLSRKLGSLSGGEMQRLRLAGIVGESLRGVLYVLDEPSQGLHYQEVHQLGAQLKKLSQSGNTVIVVDHDLGVLSAADWIIDLGPGGGNRGGEVVAQFSPVTAAKFAGVSATARVLAKEQEQLQPKRDKVKAMDCKDPSRDGSGNLRIIRPRLNNIVCDEIQFARGKLNVLAGKSGSGKSSLVYGIIFANLIKGSRWRQHSTPVHCERLNGWEDLEKVILVDRKSLAKSSVSMPATYLDVFSELRLIYSKVPEAQIAGLLPRDFSLSVSGGRCDECSGRGEIRISMRFLADAFQICPVCHGQRYQSNILSVRYAGLNLHQVLELNVESALEHFRNHRKIAKKLQNAVDLGLGYLRLGQFTSSLSGGEAQRLKLSNMLSAADLGQSLIILDEPTRGLHIDDTERLMASLKALTQSGATVLIIEHSLDVIRGCEWLVELGTGNSEKLGETSVLFMGTLDQLRHSPAGAFAKMI